MVLTLLKHSAIFCGMRLPTEKPWHFGIDPAPMRKTRSKWDGGNQPPAAHLHLELQGGPAVAHEPKSITSTSPGGEKRNRPGGIGWLVVTSEKRILVRLPKRSTMDVSEISPVSALATNPNFS